MKKRKITVWWEIPCKSAIPVFESLSDELDMDVSFVSLYEMDEMRKKLGWQTVFRGNMKSNILDEHWKQFIDKQINDRTQLHVVNGYRQNERIRYLVAKLIENDCRFGLAMEAPANLHMGWKRPVMGLSGPIIRYLRARQVVKHAIFVLSASGSQLTTIKQLGFGLETIFPFGYFPDFPFIERSLDAQRCLKIICIGFMKPFKGQDYLLRAIAKLRSRNIPISCIITGHGPTECKLRELHKQLGLGGIVEFAGVVDDQRLLELFNWSNVLVAPGYEEPWGIRINEALLSGLPVVVSDRIGASELVAASGAGEIFNSGSVESLTEAFVRYYSRISQNCDVFDAARRYRKKIEPRVAGQYVAEVIRFVEMSRNCGVSSTVSRPIPPWLAK